MLKMNIFSQGLTKEYNEFSFSKLDNLVLDIWREWKWVKDGKHAFLTFGELETSKFTTLIIHSQKEFFFLSVKSWASDKERAIETGKSFLEGLELNPEDIVVDNSKATYYKDEYGCERYVKEVCS